MPQVLVLQAAADELPNERELPAEAFEAKVDIFFEILLLPQAGHFTSPMAPKLRTSSSNGRSHSLHTNSNNGMNFSSRMGMTDMHLFLDAETPWRLHSG